jgi:uncharacterized lipoprotein YajG
MTLFRLVPVLAAVALITGCSRPDAASTAPAATGPSASAACLVGPPIGVRRGE